MFAMCVTQIVILGTQSICIPVGFFMLETVNKGNNKITELRKI